MPDIPAMAKAERHAIFDDLKTLTDEEWAASTVCAPWTVRDLVAHMTALGNQSAPNFFRGLITSGFSFDKFVAKDLLKFNDGSNADVLARFEKTLEKPKQPPGPKYVALGEYMVHSDDIRRAVGRQWDRPPEHAATLAPLYAKTGAPIAGKKRTGGLRLGATDADWTLGDGPEVVGTGADLVRAITGRADGLDNCTGDGVDTLRSRCS